MRCYSYNSTYTCNQWKFNTYNAKASCMLTHVIPLNPKDQDLAGHAITKFHLISSLTFQIIRTSKKLPFSHLPQVHVNQNSHLIFVSFLFKERARSSLESSLKPTGQHLDRKIKLHIISSSYSLKKLENSNTLSSSLPLILSGPVTSKGRFFHAIVILLLFPLKNHKLGKDSSYSHLRIQGQSHIVAWGGRGPCKNFFFPIRL